MSDFRRSDHQPQLVDRRSFLWSVGGGFGGMALSALLTDEQHTMLRGSTRSARKNSSPSFRQKQSRSSRFS